MKVSAATSITETQFTNHAAARAPGSAPEAASSPPREYRSQKKATPTTRPAPRVIQPILFPGRLDART